MGRGHTQTPLNVPSKRHRHPAPEHRPYQEASVDSLSCKLEPTVDVAHRIGRQLLHSDDKQLLFNPTTSDFHSEMSSLHLKSDLRNAWDSESISTLRKCCRRACTVSCIHYSVPIVPNCTCMQAAVVAGMSGLNAA